MLLGCTLHGSHLCRVDQNSWCQVAKNFCLTTAGTGEEVEREGRETGRAQRTSLQRIHQESYGILRPCQRASIFSQNKTKKKWKYLWLAEILQFTVWYLLLRSQICGWWWWYAASPPPRQVISQTWTYNWGQGAGWGLWTSTSFPSNCDSMVTD